MKKLILLLCVSVLGCSGEHSPDTVSNTFAQEVTDSLVYTKSAKYHICFGTAITGWRNPRGVYIEGPVMVSVDCKKVGL